MHLKKAKQRNGRIYLSITDSYYDKQKKVSRSKTIEPIGYLDELEKIYDDPIAHFSKRVEQLREEKKARNAPINFTFYDSDRLCVGDNLRKNFGYAALSKIYHELEIDKFLINRQRHTKEEYDANTIMKMLVYSRILAPASKKASYDNREWFFEKSDYSLDDVYRCLDFFNKHKENLQIWINNRIKEKYERDTISKQISRQTFSEKVYAKNTVLILLFKWGFLWTTMLFLLLMNSFPEIQTTVLLIAQTLVASKISLTLAVSLLSQTKP